MKNKNYQLQDKKQENKEKNKKQTKKKKKKKRKKKIIYHLKVFKKYNH